MNEPAKSRSEIIFEFPRFLFPPHFCLFFTHIKPPFRKTCPSKHLQETTPHSETAVHRPFPSPISPSLLSVIYVFCCLSSTQSFILLILKNNYFSRYPCMPTSAHPPLTIPSSPAPPRSASVTSINQHFCLIVLELSLSNSSLSTSPHSPISALPWRIQPT